MARWINDMIQQLKNFDANKSAPHEFPQIVWAVLQGDTGVGNAGRELLEILRTHAALERIAATGARYAIHHADPKETPLSMSIRMANGTLAIGYSGPIGSRLTADIAEAGQAWAEEKAAPKVATCPCCGKRCE